MNKTAAIAMCLMLGFSVAVFAVPSILLGWLFIAAQIVCAAVFVCKV